jgi:oligosaccharide repeat unit polymerase
MFPLYHDGQLPGIIVGFFAIGLFHQFLFKWSNSSANPMAWYLYAVSLYPLCMSVFEDAYFSSPGFWVLLWIPPVLHWLGKLMFKEPHKQAQVC